MQTGSDQFGLDDRSLEELKNKAIAAKGRAYCRSFGFICTTHYYYYYYYCTAFAPTRICIFIAPKTRKLPMLEAV